MTRVAWLGTIGVMAGLALAIAAETMAPALPEADDATGIRPAARMPHLEAAATRAPEQDHTDMWVATSLGRPLFTRDRRPVTDNPTPLAAAAQSLPRLAGITVSPNGRKAIFAGDDGKPLVLGEGGSVAGYTIRTIGTAGVRLEGPDGQRSLTPAFDPKQHVTDADLTPQNPELPQAPPGQGPVFPLPGQPGAPRFRMPTLPGQPPMFRQQRGDSGAAWAPPIPVGGGPAAFSLNTVAMG